MRSWMTAVLLAGVLAGCGTPSPGPSPAPVTPTTTTTPPAVTSTVTTPARTPATTPVAPQPKPAWHVGRTPLPLRPDGLGQVLPTPPVLVNRKLPTTDILPPPADGSPYAAAIRPIPAAVLARSTWRADCPVTQGELRYLTMSFWGFDGRPHTGEMIVNARVAQQVTEVFDRLYQARFPIEEMRVTAVPELDAPPTGDGNNTNAFVCRPAVGMKRWSAHASGLAVDVNPFCNPYIKGDIVLPELASAYLDRANARPGMLRAGDVAVRAFSAIGWTWGGTWTNPKDTMHFSATGS